MKNSRKRFLSGVLASSLALSVGAATVANEVQKVNLEEEVVAPVALVAEAEVSSSKMRSAYATFYGQHGENKAADVFFNGKSLNFVDAFPLIEEGTTYVPLAVFSDAIGCSVSWNGEERLVTLGYQGNEITFEVGDSGYYVNGGERKELPFPTFETFDRTMVPVRFITDVFGLNLYWNASTKQVIAADLDSLKAEISGNYELMDAYFALMNTGVNGHNVKVNGDFDYAVTIDGKEVSMDVNLVSLANQALDVATYDLNVSMDFSDYEQALREMMTMFSSEGVDETVFATVVNAFQDFNLDYTYDMTNLEFYVKSSLFESLAPVFTVDGEFTMDSSAWYKLAASDYMLASDLTGLRSMLDNVSTSQEVNSMEELVEMVMEMTRYYNNHDVDLYGSLVALMSMSSDDKFVKDGNSYFAHGTFTYGDLTSLVSLELKTDDTGALIGSESSLGQYDGGFNMDLVLSQNASDRISVDMIMVANGAEYHLDGDFVFVATDEVASVPTGNVIDLIDFGS